MPVGSIYHHFIEKEGNWVKDTWPTEWICGEISKNLCEDCFDKKLSENWKKPKNKVMIEVNKIKCGNKMPIGSTFNYYNSSLGYWIKNTWNEEWICGEND